MQDVGPRNVDYRYLLDELNGNQDPNESVRDTRWLRLVGEQEWLAITRDLRILEREVERRTLIESRARVVILRPGDSFWSEMLEFLLAQMGWLQRIYAEVAPPFVYIAHIAEPIERVRFVDLSR